MSGMQEPFSGQWAGCSCLPESPEVRGRIVQSKIREFVPSIPFLWCGAKETHRLAIQNGRSHIWWAGLSERQSAGVFKHGRQVAWAPFSKGKGRNKKKSCRPYPACKKMVSGTEMSRICNMEILKIFSMASICQTRQSIISCQPFTSCMCGWKRDGRSMSCRNSPKWPLSWVIAGQLTKTRKCRSSRRSERYARIKKSIPASK